VAASQQSNCETQSAECAVEKEGCQERSRQERAGKNAHRCTLEAEGDKKYEQMKKQRKCDRKEGMRTREGKCKEE
jgi:hypothetical protein